MFYFTARHREQLWVEMVPCDLYDYYYYKSIKRGEIERKTDGQTVGQM